MMCLVEETPLTAAAQEQIITWEEEKAEAECIQLCSVAQLGH
jgi:hypothetical protein